MRNLTLLSIFIFSINTFGQNFPGTEIQLLIGKELKVTEMSEPLQSLGYQGFFTDEKLKKIFSQNSIFQSKYNSLVGKIFKVISYEPYIDKLGSNKFKLKIENTETGIIFFDYDPRLEFLFRFEVIGGINFPEGFFCKDIEETKDKFTGEVSYSSPYLEGISFIKVKKEGTEKIYLSIQEAGATINFNIKGVILLLENGFRIEKPDAVLDVKLSSIGTGYIYSAFIELNSDDIKLLTINKITDDRLYIYDGTISKGERIREYLKCIINK